ncbi:ATP-dependent DNA helicase PIF1-like [Aphis craccivora]|uniref:ATP-dependent DNA helicase PIF1-like n=1 Tax=Aphis craccivora TaxID=307492 RepID=A0A6G0Y7Y6_APHCR|nr:ATP-dependent DNA helicase PIF1-like [Aphis craccivora]
MKIDETGGLPYKIELLIKKPYMIRVNIDMVDGLVNGAIDLKQSDMMWRTHPCIDKRWSLIGLRPSTITLPSKIISFKRMKFPLTPACAISIQKSQGSTSGDYRFYHGHKKELKEIRIEFERLARLSVVTKIASFHSESTRLKIETSSTYLTNTNGLHLLDAPVGNYVIRLTLCVVQLTISPSVILTLEDNIHGDSFVKQHYLFQKSHTVLELLLNPTDKIVILHCNPPPVDSMPIFSRYTGQSIRDQ